MRMRSGEPHPGWLTSEDEALVQDADDGDVFGAGEGGYGAEVGLEAAEGECEACIVSFSNAYSQSVVLSQDSPIVNTSTMNAAPRNSHAFFPPSTGRSFGSIFMIAV